MCIKITAVLWVSLRVGAVLSTLADTQLCWASCWLIMKDIYNNFFMSKKNSTVYIIIINYACYGRVINSRNINF